MAVYISGSIAFDRIMSFDGNFKDHIIADKLDKVNISFMVNDMVVRRGGCAGNIAYTLALLGGAPYLVSAVGRDFAEYGADLKKLGVNLDGVYVDENKFTALCYITTDRNSNQIAGFYPGAMFTASDYAFPNLTGDDLAIVSPGNMEEMEKFPALYREKGVRFIFDPGQQLPVFTKELMEKCVEGAYIYICNDYELSMTVKLLGLEKEEDLLTRVEYMVTTLGENGCRIRGRDGSDITVGVCPVEKVADPTGAGDSHRSGLLYGLTNGLSLEESAKLGAVCASYAISYQGTQVHSFTKEEFRARYEAAFGPFPAGL